MPAHLPRRRSDLEAAAAVQLADEQAAAAAAGDSPSSPVDWDRLFPPGATVDSTCQEDRDYGLVMDLSSHPDVVGLVTAEQAGPDKPAGGQAGARRAGGRLLAAAGVRAAHACRCCCRCCLACCVGRPCCVRVLTASLSLPASLSLSLSLTLSLSLWLSLPLSGSLSSRCHTLCDEQRALPRAPACWTWPR